MSDDIKIGLSVDDTNGSVGKRANETKALREELDKVTKSANEAAAALKQVASEQAASSTHAMGGSRAAAKAAKIVTSMDDTDVTDYRRAKGITNATGAGARDFAREAQGLGGLVHVYATFAANIFAVTAAYSMLDKAFSTVRISEATDMLSTKLGVNLKHVSNNLVEATGHAISFQEALQFTNVGTAAGLTGKQIENLTVVAKGAANALGRDMGDSVRRIIQGTAKQEQEILDELGIFVRSKKAYEDYAKAIGSRADDLSGTQRTLAYADAVAKAGEKWKDFAAIDDPFSRFTSSAKEAGNSILVNLAKPLSSVLGLLADNKDMITGLMLLIATKLGSMAMPHIGDKLKTLFTADPEELKKFESNNAIIIKGLEKRIAAAKKEVSSADKAIAGLNPEDKLAKDFNEGKLKDLKAVDAEALKMAKSFEDERLRIIKTANKEQEALIKAQAKLHQEITKSGTLEDVLGTAGVSSKTFTGKLGKSVDPNDLASIKQGISGTITQYIKGEESLQAAKNASLVTQKSTLNNIIVNSRTLDSLAKSTKEHLYAQESILQKERELKASIAGLDAKKVQASAISVKEAEGILAINIKRAEVEAKSLATSEAMVALGIKQAALEQRRQAALSDIHSLESEINGVSASRPRRSTSDRALADKDMTANKMAEINNILIPQAGISTMTQLGVIWSNLKGMWTEAAVGAVGLEKASLKASAAMRIAGVTGSLAIRGIFAAMGPLMWAWTALDLIILPAAEKLGIFSKESDTLNAQLKDMKDNLDLTTKTMEKLRAVEAKPNQNLEDRVKSYGIITNLLNTAKEDADKLGTSLQGIDKGRTGLQVGGFKDAASSAEANTKLLVSEGLIKKNSEAYLALKLVAFDYGYVAQDLSNKLITQQEANNLGIEISDRYSSALELARKESEKLGASLENLTGISQGANKALDDYDKAHKNALDRNLPSIKDPNAQEAYKKYQALTEEFGKIGTHGENAKQAEDNRKAATLRILEDVVRLRTFIKDHNIKVELPIEIMQTSNGVLTPAALAALAKSSTEAFKLAPSTNGFEKSPDVELKRLEMKAKLASQEVTLQNLSISNAEKLGTITSSTNLDKKYDLEVTLARVQYEKDIHQIEKEKTGDIGTQKALAEKILQGKITELGISEKILGVQAATAKLAREQAIDTRASAREIASLSLSHALGNTSTSGLQEAKDAQRRQAAQAKVDLADQQINKEAWRNAINEQQILESTIKQEHILTKQVDERNTLSNQAFVYNEYMKKAIEEGATLSDFTSFEITNREIILKTMEAQLIVARQYSGEEKASYLAKLRLETDMKLKDDEKLKRLLALKDLEREIDSSDRSKVTKDRVLAVAADEAFTRYEDFRNKMRGVITGTFDAVYKGMDTAIDSLTTKMMKGQKVTARDLLRDFGNAAAEEFRQMSADRMKLAFRTTVSGVLGGSAADDARKAERDKAERPITLAMEGNGYLKSMSEGITKMAGATADISDKTIDPAKPASPAIIAAEAAKAKAVSKLSTSEFVGPPAPVASANGWMDAGSTKNTIGNSALGMLSGLLMSKAMGSNNKLAPWITAIGGGLMSGMGSQAGGMMGGLGKLFGFENGGIMSSLGSVPLNKYANGGVATSPQLALFGEGKMNEAYVPLPDGRTIPVSMKSPVGGGVINSSSQTNQVTVHVNPTTGTTNTSASGMDPAMMQQLGNSIGAKVREELMFQKRPGGLLY